MENRDKIKAVGLKSTPQRELVYGVIQKLCHASIDEIIECVHSSDPNITISTIYRIMDSFTSSGLISRFNHPDSKTYYDVTPTEHHHIFTQSGEILDLEDDELSDIIRERLKSRIDDGQRIKRISVQIITEGK